MQVNLVTKPGAGQSLFETRGGSGRPLPEDSNYSHHPIEEEDCTCGSRQERLGSHVPLPRRGGPIRERNRALIAG